MNDRLIECFVTIGKNKRLSHYIFKFSDFGCIEDSCLVIKGERRKLKLSDEDRMQLVYQINYVFPNELKSK